MAGKDTKKMIIIFLKNTTTNQRELRTYGTTRTTKKNQNTSSWCLCGLWLILPLVFLFISCQSTPHVADLAKLKATFPLDNGAAVYIFADAKEARPLLELLPIEELKDNQVRQMIDMTDFFAAALFTKESGRRFQIAAQGNYPSARASIALGFSKNWKELRADSGHSYWNSEENKLSIALGPKQAFISSSIKENPGDPITSGPGVDVPEGFDEFYKSFPVTCWLFDGGAVVNRLLNSGGSPVRFPVQGVFIAFYHAEKGKYQSSIRMQFENEASARRVSNLFSVANNYIYGELGGKSMLTSIFFANTPVLNGRYLDIKTAPLSESEISLLLRTFLL